MFVFDIFNIDNVMSQLTRTGNGEHNGISAGHNHDKGSDGRTDTRNSSSLFIFFLSGLSVILNTSDITYNFAIWLFLRNSKLLPEEEKDDLTSLCCCNRLTVLFFDSHFAYGRFNMYCSLMCDSVSPCLSLSLCLYLCLSASVSLFLSRSLPSPCPSPCPPPSFSPFLPLPLYPLPPSLLLSLPPSLSHAD